MTLGKRKCIYCLRDLEASAFDTEHVLPQAFGTFRANLTLTDCVCKDCNNYFGRTLEFVLARDSIEALRRLQYGLKSVQEVDDLPLDRLSFSIAQESELKGLRMRLRDEAGELVCEPLPQVGLAKKAGHGWIWLTEQELDDLGKAIPAGVDPVAGTWIIAPSEADAERVVALLAAKGISFQKKVDQPFPGTGPDSSMHEIRYGIDPIIRRCVAKIAFNYMAYMAGAHFVYHPDFNVTRSFIRYGDSPSYPLVMPTQDPVLASESPRWRGTNNHLTTVNWSPLGRSVVGQVSLFNEITYKVSLARDFSGLWLDIRTGHCFDIKKRRVRPLVYSRLRRRK